jgi:ABC-type nitrate/sulfonate/bicarbonate transport system ATPase subunit
MTVAENIRFGLSRLDRDSAEQRTAELLAALGLKELAAPLPAPAFGAVKRGAWRWRAPWHRVRRCCSWMSRSPT